MFLSAWAMESQNVSQLKAGGNYMEPLAEQPALKVVSRESEHDNGIDAQQLDLMQSYVSMYSAVMWYAQLGDTNKPHRLKSEMTVSDIESPGALLVSVRSREES